MNNYHIPVMLKEVIDFLNVQMDQWYIDANLGGGGHTQEILNKRAKVLGIDLDPDAINEVAKNHNLSVKKTDDHLQVISNNLILYQSNFNQLSEIVQKLALGPICGVLFDLGVSSYQLEQPQKGFSFYAKAPLDMRMDPAHQTITAADLVNALHENELATLIQNLGEESYAKKIAKKIVEERKNNKIENTDDLTKIISCAKPRSKSDRTHPATQTFQALRIAVNDELNSLRSALPQALNSLTPGGRLVVISFHSLEDRIVKNFFKDEQQKGTVKIITQKPITPSEIEVSLNPRSRSSKLRVAEKT